MGLTKRMFEQMQEIIETTDYDYQYEQWLNNEAEKAAYEEMLADVASFMVIK